MNRLKQMNGRLLKLHKESKLDEKLYSRLRCSSGRIPLFYGLPKVHKHDIPLRPIVSFCSSPTYALSKYLAGILSPLVGCSERSVSTSVEFIRSIRNVEIAPDDAMVSFDVVSLFTCIPTNLAVSTALERLRHDGSLEERTSLNPEEICGLLEFCLNSTVFGFKGRFYRQKRGTAMGSPVSSVVANLCMEAFENSALDECIYCVKVWKRYVDDTFVILPRSSVADFHLYLNSLNPHIQFTLEEEDCGSLPFLDVRINRDGHGRLLTTVFRKPTHTDRYLDFRSHHPASHKASVIRALHQRAYTHCCNDDLRNVELRRNKSVLKKNGYPSKFIARNQCGVSGGNRNVEDETRKTSMVLPYVAGVSERLSRILSCVNVKTYYKPVYTLCDLLLKVKDRVPEEEKSGAIYQIPCGDCDKVYVGQTGRSIRLRGKEHMRAVARGDDSSQLAEHVHREGHEPDWHSMKVLHQNVTNLGSRLFLES